MGPVIATIDLRGSDLDGLDLGSIVPRAPFDVDAATAVVAPLIAEVAERGAEALADYSARFDQVVPESFRVPVAMIEQAVADLDPALRSAIETSISAAGRWPRWRQGSAMPVSRSHPAPGSPSA